MKCYIIGEQQLGESLVSSAARSEVQAEQRPALLSMTVDLL